MMLLKGMAMMAAASSVAAHVRTLHPRAYTPTRASQTERVPLLARVTHWHLTYPIDPALAEHLPQAPGREVSDALHSLPMAGLDCVCCLLRLGSFPLHPPY
jgi:hypothetical protein